LGKACALPQLLSLQQIHGHRFDDFNLSAFWSKFKKLPRGELGELHGCLAPVCEQTVRMLPELEARKLANVAHAFAKAGLVGNGPWQNVWAALPNAVRRRLGSCNAQELSNTAWAFATAGHAPQALFGAISAEVARRGLREFNTQNLSNTAWAFATAGHAPQALFGAISAEVARRGLRDFNAQNLSNMARSFAKAGHALQALFGAISAEVARRGLHEFNAQNLSNTAWAFATVGHASLELLDAISAEVLRRGLGDFNEQELSNMAWAFTVLDPPSADTLFGTACFTTRCVQILKASFLQSQLSQLHQWSIWRNERGARWPGLPDSFRQACREAFVSKEGDPSQLQRDVVQEIRSRGGVHDVQEEHRCEASGYSIDALVTLNDGRRVAVEVDGPSHFLGRSHQPTGATLLKRRQLRYFEWHLESVLYWKWDSGSMELHWLPATS
jgi:hypothetical protein